MAPATAPAPAPLKVESIRVRKWTVDGKAEVTEVTPGKFSIDCAYGHVDRDRLRRVHAALGAMLTDTASDPAPPAPAEAEADAEV